MSIQKRTAKLASAKPASTDAPPPKPYFVAISDIHFNVKNLALSTTALTQAMQFAKDLEVPLVVAGDLHDTKAIIRAEVANVLLDMFKDFNQYNDAFILVGNHDLVNEKGTAHGLNYLRQHAIIMENWGIHAQLDKVLFIPYQSDPAAYKSACRALDRFNTPYNMIVCHQGFAGANMGDYIQDKSAVGCEFAQVPTISGHYHKHQTLGNVTYIGNPYTMSFGEANDGPKGFLVVNEDGSFKHIPITLRKHLKINLKTCQQEIDGHTAYGVEYPHPNVAIGAHDLVWIQLHGNKSSLDKISKKDFLYYVVHSNFKLDKIPTDAEELVTTKPLTDHETLDALIDNLSEPATFKQKLKTMWRGLLK